MNEAETDVQEPIRLYMEDANGTLYLAEQVGWIGTADRSGSRFGTRRMFDDDEPIFRLVEQQRAELRAASEGLDEAIRAACLPNMRKAFAGEPITAGDIEDEQAALDAIRTSWADD